MKTKLILTLLAIYSLSFSGYGQDYSSLKDIPLKNKTDYSAAEPKVLECSKFILQSPTDAKNINHLYCLQFMMRWMEGTPDYTFSLDETIGEIIKANESLLGVYLASMTSYVLENKDKAKDMKEVKFNAISTLIDYCTNGANNIKPDKTLAKMIKAKRENKLRDYLKLN